MRAQTRNVAGNALVLVRVAFPNPYAESTFEILLMKQ
jgi:hypothetical protein